VCWRLNEDGGHCFLKCKFVKKGWQALHLEGVRLQLLALKSPKEIVHDILQRAFIGDQFSVGMVGLQK
jgi:hypothetical protein